MAQRDVLIVEDDRQYREILHLIFLHAGYNCLLASDGGEGLEVFRGSRPPLVVTDLGLPVVSGTDLLQQVRQEDADAAVIVLFSPVPAKTAIASLRLGAYAFLMKPVNMDELLIVAERALERRQLLIERHQYQGLIDIAQRDVLIVEHDPNIRFLLREIFLRAGYTCRLASDGNEGLEVFRGSRPELILTELNVPMMRGGERVAGAGIELLQQVRREDPDAAVIVLGGMDGKAHVESLKLGAYAHLWKPVDMDELLIAAERALERRQLLVERRRRGDAPQKPESKRVF